jgi:hypothetical protein
MRRATRIQRGTDPDDLLQQTLDLARADIRRLEAKVAAGKALTPAERAGVMNTLREVRLTAFGGRRLMTDRHLRKLSEGELHALEKATEEEEAWLAK